MRLIDADAMLMRNEHSIYDTTDLKEMLDYEPTAFEVDKVIEQLEDNLWMAQNNSSHLKSVVNLNRAIEIVKGVMK